MTTDALGRARATTEPEVARTQAKLSDPADVADRAWTQALASCATKLHLEGIASAAQKMLQGDQVARLHCCHGLAEAIAGSLWASYQDLRAVYSPDCDSCPQSFCLDDGAGANLPCVHLLVWAPQRTTALTVRGAALGNALARACQENWGVQQVPNLLQIGVMDDGDLAKLFGEGRRKRWPARLEAYWLSQNEGLQTLRSRHTVF